MADGLLIEITIPPGLVACGILNRLVISAQKPGLSSLSFVDDVMVKIIAEMDIHHCQSNRLLIAILGTVKPEQ